MLGTPTEACTNQLPLLSILQKKNISKTSLHTILRQTQMDHFVKMHSNTWVIFHYLCNLNSVQVTACCFDGSTSLLCMALVIRFKMHISRFLMVSNSLFQTHFNWCQFKLSYFIVKNTKCKEDEASKATRGARKYSQVLVLCLGLHLKSSGLTVHNSTKFS